MQDSSPVNLRSQAPTGVLAMPGRLAVRSIVSTLLVLALAGCALVDRLSGEGEARQIRAIGLPAQARVLDLHDTGVSVNDDPIVGFELEVLPEHGAPYPARTRARVSRLHLSRVQPGAVLPVAIDPDDPARVALAIYRD